MSDLYRKRTDSQSAFTKQLFPLFCEGVGYGDANDFAKILYGKHTVEDFSYADDFLYWTVYGYFKDVVIPHKIAVFKAGMEFTKKVWFPKFISENAELWTDNLYLHDISKFSANESFGYALHNFNKKDYFDLSFERAWNHHKHHNEHHPEYWISADRQGDTTFLPMPKIYIAEMVADWIGAGEVYGNPLSEWLPKNLHTFRFHQQTAIDLQFFLHKLGIDTWIHTTSEKGVRLSTTENPLGF